MPMSKGSIDTIFDKSKNAFEITKLFWTCMNNYLEVLYPCKRDFRNSWYKVASRNLFNIKKFSKTDPKMILNLFTLKSNCSSAILGNLQGLITNIIHAKKKKKPTFTCYLLVHCIKIGTTLINNNWRAYNHRIYYYFLSISIILLCYSKNVGHVAF